MNNMFRTMVLRSAPARVDREAKRINGVKVMQLGRVNDTRPYEVDDKTLEQVVTFGNQPNKGIKARFTHPNMSDDGFGKYLGRLENFRREGDAAYADLQLAESSFQTPNGDLGTYVMNLAEEDPEAFGMSAATNLAKVMQSKVPEGEAIPLRIDGLRAVDFVDEPAATRGGLFDMTTPQGLPALATWIVETHFSDREPREVVERLCSFLSKHYGRDIMSEVLAGDAGKNETAPAPAPVAPAGQLSMDAAKPFLEAFGDRGATWYLQGKSFSDCLAIENAELKAAKAESDLKYSDLEKRLEAAIKASGHDEEKEFSSGDPLPQLTDSQKAAAQKAQDLKARGVPESVAKFAAALAPSKN